MFLSLTLAPLRTLVPWRRRCELALSNFRCLLRFAFCDSHGYDMANSTNNSIAMSPPFGIFFFLRLQSKLMIPTGDHQRVTTTRTLLVEMIA